jgi:hypothetical protein
MYLDDSNFDPDAMMGLSTAQASPLASLFGANGYHYADPSQMQTLTGQNRGGSNAWLWQPTEQNTVYNPYQFGGQNNYMTGEVARYLRALGYQGNTPEGGDIGADDATAINQFLGQHGLSVQTGTHHVPGYSQNTGIQRIIDANGVPVAVDARNNRYDGNDRLTDIGKAAAIAAGGYYALNGLPGVGASAGSGAGAGAMEGTLLDLLGAEGMGSLGFGSSAAGALGGVGQAIGSVSGAIGSAANLVGGGQNLAGIVGGLLGATQGGGNNTATTQSRTDPRFDSYLYGTGAGDTNSLLGAAQQLWQQNRTGLNPTMQAGLDMQRNALQDPAYAQGYTQMRNVGSGLLGGPVAGNPFTMASTPQFGRNSPAMQQSPENPFMGMFAQTQTMPQRGLLNPFGG